MERLRMWVVSLALAALCLVIGGHEAKAQGKQPTYEIGYSSWATSGVICTSGTAGQINIRPSSFTVQIAGYRIQNQDSTYSVWLGTSASISTSTLAGDIIRAPLGPEIQPKQTLPMSLGKVATSTGILFPIYCMAANGVGATGATLCVEWFGY